MLDRNFLQSFLKINNASEHMSDAEVRSVLSRAGWTQSEADAALALLRSGVGGSGATMPSLAAAGALPFRPELEFSSSQISALLGVDVEIDPHAVRPAYHDRSRHASRVKKAVLQVVLGFSTIALSVGLAAGFGACFFYFFEIGPFRG